MSNCDEEFTFENKYYHQRGIPYKRNKNSYPEMQSIKTVLFTYILH